MGMAIYKITISKDSSTRFWMHKTTGLKFEEQSQVCNELVEGERDEQVNKEGNQPILYSV